MNIRVRQALLHDVGAISAIYQARVPADYAAMSIYERWLHGGAWMSLETCAVWIGHLLQRHDGIPLVAELDGEVWGHAEVFIGAEAEPYGQHLNVSALCVHPQAEGRGLGRALLHYIEEMAQALQCPHITAAQPNPPEFFAHLGFAPHTARYLLRFPAESGRVFYKAYELSQDDPAQIAGWYMPLGRFQNAREEWERLWWTLWNGVPQLVESNWHRLSIDLTGQPGILHLHQETTQPETATARLWTKRVVSSHILSAVRDRAFRLGYEQIMTLVDEALRPALPDAEELNPKAQWLYIKKQFEK